VKRGRDISIDVELDFGESVFGTERRVLLTKFSLCAVCQGTGGEPGSSPKTCPVCGGSGAVRESRESIFGTFSRVSECKTCQGRATVYERKCNECKGQGVVKRGEEVQIAIPAGIRDGEIIKLSGRGEAMAGGITGDLYVRINVASHPLFRREGSNLVMDLEIPLSEALLGGERVVNTLDGRIKVKIPAGIDSGELLRIRGKGVPSPDQSKRGDLIIRVFVKIPKRLSRKARDLVEELKKEGI